MICIQVSRQIRRGPNAPPEPAITNWYIQDARINVKQRICVLVCSEDDVPEGQFTDGQIDAVKTACLMLLSQVGYTIIEKDVPYFNAEEN